MNEIELKAHVLNRRETENKLNSFAQFKSTVTKDDVYYFNPAISEKSIRIRKETENENCRYTDLLDRNALKKQMEKLSGNLVLIVGLQIKCLKMENCQEFIKE